MFVAKIENQNGEILTLTQKENKYQVISITGLDEPPAQVNLTNIALLDGSKKNSTKLNTRNVVITLKLNGDVEQNRHELYHYFRTKEDCTFYYKSALVDVFIRGIVETVECVIFSNAETMQVSIICPQPYFSSINQIVADISNHVAGFTFPFSIEYNDPIPFSSYVINRITNVFNSSTAETGAIVEVDLYDDDISKVKIQNTDTGEFIELQYDFEDGDKIIISTIKGQKYVHLLRDGTESNIFGSLQDGSKFFQLKTGDNNFSYSINDGDLDDKVFITFRFYNLYRGV